jgi:hypothetical protein
MVVGGLVLLSRVVSADSVDGGSERMVSRDRMRDVVDIRDLRLGDDGLMSGVVVNRSGNPLRDVKLSLRYEWRWNREMRPGDDPPGLDSYYTIPQIPAGGQVPFEYRPDSALPARSDGQFVPDADVVSVTEILIGTAAVPPPGQPATRAESPPSATR